MFSLEYFLGFSFVKVDMNLRDSRLGMTYGKQALPGAVLTLGQDLEVETEE